MIKVIRMLANFVLPLRRAIELILRHVNEPDLDLPRRLGDDRVVLPMRSLFVVSGMSLIRICARPANAPFFDGLLLGCI
jgi:hypothetical protein